VADAPEKKDRNGMAPRGNEDYNRNEEELNMDRRQREFRMLREIHEGVGEQRVDRLERTGHTTST
jgi:hypothetical protein